MFMRFLFPSLIGGGGDSCSQTPGWKVAKKDGEVIL